MQRLRFGRATAMALVCVALLLTARPAWASTGTQDKTFDSNGVKIRYTVDGASEGEPVLLIHGFTSNIEGQWATPGVIKALAPKYRVIAIDNRGHGKSGKPHDPKQYGIEMVKDSIRLLDHLKIDKAHVVGYSMGAMITAKLLVTYPERLRSATLGGAVGLRDGDPNVALLNTLAESLEQGKGFGPLIEALAPAGQPKPNDQTIKLISGMLAATNDTKALAAAVRGFKEFIVKDEQMKANKVPLQSLIGALDPLKVGVDALKERLPDLRVVVVPGADHMSAFTKSEFIDGLQEFLAKNSGRGGK